MKQRELDKILHRHKGWLNSKNWGVKANLRGSNLEGANLRGANLEYTTGIISFGPIGKSKRIGCAVMHENGPMIKLGCFWGNMKEAKNAIEIEYGKDSSYWKVVKACCDALMEDDGELTEVEG